MPTPFPLALQSTTQVAVLESTVPTDSRHEDEFDLSVLLSSYGRLRLLEQLFGGVVPILRSKIVVDFNSRRLKVEHLSSVAFANGDDASQVVGI